MSSINDIIKLAKEYMPGEDLASLLKANEYAAGIHKGMKHAASGKSYLSHAQAVAHVLVSMRLDLQTVLSGILHGALKEDVKSSAKELEENFGKDVTSIVRGATKIANVRFNSKLSYQAENIRKLLLAMASDIRVLLVKLADRLVDMRTLAAFNEEDTRELAQESQDLYAPLASRLGIDWMKRELEDLSFKFLHVEEYVDLNRKIESSNAERKEYVDEVIDILKKKLAENGITDCRILGRPKHLYSIYKKIIAQQIPVEKVYDKVAFRILVHSVKECYEALGVMHANWAPVTHRIRDFISTPKANNYQSLHTTVVGPHERFMEVQIRTEEMDRIAVEGIAAHWAYKEGKSISKEDVKVSNWLKQLVQWLQDLKDPKEFLESVKGELYQKDVYALTPNGEVKEFPQGSTPIDFAYSIHTEVGDKCTGARVNGRIVPLKYQLQNGDLVEILTSPNQRPRRGWLSLVKSSRARSRIRGWLRKEEQEKAISVGREICERELRKHNITLKKVIKTGHIKALLKKLRCNSIDDFLSKVGTGKLTIKSVLKVMQPEEFHVESEIPIVKKKTAEFKPRKPKDDPISIEGVKGMLVKISNCCMPVPGDEIVGFITMGRGVSIHKANCHNLLATDPQRRMDVSWSNEVHTVHRAHIKVVTQNKKGMLAALGNAISEKDANIIELDARTTSNNLGLSNLVVEVENVDQLQGLLQHLRQLNGVIEAVRI